MTRYEIVNGSPEIFFGLLHITFLRNLGIGRKNVAYQVFHDAFLVMR